LWANNNSKEKPLYASNLPATNGTNHPSLLLGGNLRAYHDPDNRYLHRVIETRRGIPITLAVLFVELARHVAGQPLTARAEVHPRRTTPAGGRQVHTPVGCPEMPEQQLDLCVTEPEHIVGQSLLV
jgi:hypothetical protein